VDNGYHALCEHDDIGLGQGVRGAFDASLVAGGMQERARQGGFASAQVAVQVDRQAWHQGGGQRSPQGSGAGFVLQVNMVELHNFYKMIQ